MHVHVSWVFGIIDSVGVTNKFPCGMLARTIYEGLLPLMGSTNQTKWKKQSRDFLSFISVF